MHPPEEVWNFAYGGNMNPRVLLRRRRIHPLESVAGFLKDYRLAFNLRGFPFFEPAFANIVPSPGDCVHGVLHRLTWDQLRRLDRFEGKGLAYRHLNLEVETYSHRKILARVYSAIMISQEKYPSCRYLNIIREGARYYQLDPEYVQMLDNHICRKRYNPSENLTSIIAKFFAN